MINNIIVTIPANKTYPKLIEWTYRGKKNSVETYGYDTYKDLLDKLVKAQISREPKAIKQIKYIRSKR